MKKLVIRLLFCIALILPMSFLNAVYGSEQEITTVIGEDDTKSVPPGCDPNRGCIDPYATFLHLNGHIQYIGWVQTGNMSGVGTVGQSLRLEAITLALGNDYYGQIPGGIEYQAHVQWEGWQQWKRNGEVAGTTGLSYRMEALRIRLTGAAAVNYNLTYRAHVQNIGWQAPVNQGEVAGTTGQSLRMECIEIAMTPKGITYNNDIYKEEEK